MNFKNMQKEELIFELKTLQQKYDLLKAKYAESLEKDSTKGKTSCQVNGEGERNISTLELTGNSANMAPGDLDQEFLPEPETIIHAITKFAHDAILMLDNKGNISYCNDAAVTIFGYQKDEILGNNLNNILIPELHRDRFRKAFLMFQTESLFSWPEPVQILPKR